MGTVTRIVCILLPVLVSLASAWTIRANFPVTTISTTQFNDTSGWSVKEGTACINKTSGSWRFFLAGTSKIEFNNSLLDGYDASNPLNPSNLRFRNRVALYCPTSTQQIQAPTASFAPEAPPVSGSIPVAAPVTSPCAGSPPEPQDLFFCDPISRTYKLTCNTIVCAINSTVLLNNTPVTVTQTVQVSGSITGNSGSQIKIIFDPSSGTTSGLNVSECLSAEIPVLVDIPPNTPPSASNSGTILSYASCSGQEATVRFSSEGWDECATGFRRRLETTRAAARVNVALIFEPKDPSQCASNSVNGDGNMTVIIGGAVGGAAALIVVIAIVALAVRPVREKIFPFMKRSKQVQRETLTD